MATTLDSVIARLERMQQPAFLEGIARALGNEMVRQVGIGFDTRSDAYGVTWKPRKGDYPWPTLERTRALRRSFRVVSVGADHVRIASDCAYAPYHQFGTRSIDVRRMIPDSSRGLGVWGARMRYLASAELMGALNG